MWLRGVGGILLCAVGAVWVLQGTNVIHGSGMSGHGQWGIIGIIVLLAGLASIGWAVLLRRRGPSQQN